MIKISSFQCEFCGKDILDSPAGYYTFCEHYPEEHIHTISIPLEFFGIDEEALELISDAKDSD